MEISWNVNIESVSYFSFGVVNYKLWLKEKLEDKLTRLLTIKI